VYPRAGAGSSRSATYFRYARPTFREDGTRPDLDGWIGGAAGGREAYGESGTIPGRSVVTRLHDALRVL